MDPTPAGRTITPPCRVMIVDDHPGVRRSLERVLATAGDLRCVGSAADCESAVTMSRRLRPDVVLMDIRLPDCDGVEATRRIVSERPEVRVIILTSLPSPPTLARATAAGAVAYLLKDEPVEHLLTVIRDAANQPA